MLFEDKIWFIKHIGDISKMGVFVYDLSSAKFQYVNPFLCRMFFVERDHLMSDPMLAISQIEPDDVGYMETALKQMRKKKSIEALEFSILQKRRRTLSIDAFFLEESNAIAAFVKDITSQKEHHQYLVNYGAKKDTLLEMLTHHLSGSLKMSQRVLQLTDRSAGGPVSQKDQLEFAKNVNEQCISSIQEFLKEEHFVSEKISLGQSRYDVVEEIQVIIDQYRKSHPRRSNDISFEFAEGSLFVTGDNVKFMQVVNNLMSNAIKFTPDNCGIKISLQESEEEFHLSVADDGIGIPRHLQPLIFQKYTPAGRMGLNGEKPIGVGLSISKKLVDLMGGKIHFESAEDRGSIFHVTLPKH